MEILTRNKLLKNFNSESKDVVFSPIRCFVGTIATTRSGRLQKKAIPGRSEDVSSQTPVVYDLNVCVVSSRLEAAKRSLIPRARKL